MSDNLTGSKNIELHPKYLWFLILAYSMIVILANWYAPQFIDISSVDINAGMLMSTPAFLLSGLITEVYGYKYARRAIWCGFLFNVLLIIYGQVVIYMPSPDYPTNNALFNALLATNIKFFFASSISYLCSEPLNSYLIAKLKIKMPNRYIVIRFALSIIAAASIGNIIFSFIGFYGKMSSTNLISFMITMLFIKGCILLIGLPVFIYISNKLKKFEELDIYDRETNFNIFSFKVNYSAMDNEFGNHEMSASKPALPLS